MMHPRNTMFILITCKFVVSKINVQWVKMKQPDFKILRSKIDSWISRMNRLCGIEILMATSCYVLL